MRLWWNPISGQYEDDPLAVGTPALPAAPAPLAMPNITPPMGAVGAGSSPGYVFPPPPAFESTVSSERRIRTPSGVAADETARRAASAQVAAETQGSQAGAAEDIARGAELEERASTLEGQQAQNRLFEEEIARANAEGKSLDDEGIKKNAELRKKANGAETSQWGGNRAGEVIAALLRGIDRTASSYRGETGPSGVDRILQSATAAHEKKLVGEWEASEDAERKRRSNHGEYLTELHRRKGTAAQESLIELQVIGLRGERALLTQAPEKRAAASAQFKSALEAAGARELQKREDARDTINRVSRTDRSLAEGDRGGAAQRGLDYRQGEDLRERLVRDPISGQPRGYADNNAIAMGLTQDGQQVAKIMLQVNRLSELKSKLPSALSDPKGYAKSIVTAEGQSNQKQFNLISVGLKGQLTQYQGAGAPTGAEGAEALENLSRGNFTSNEAYADALSQYATLILEGWRSALPASGVAQVDPVTSPSNPHRGKPRPAAEAPPTARPSTKAAPEGNDFAVETRTKRDGTVVRVRRHPDGSYDLVK